MSLFSLVSLALTAILAENFVLVKFLGICPFLGVSKKTDTALGMGMAVVFVMGLASMVTWLVNKFFLIPQDLQYMQTVVFILVIAALVQFVELFLKKFVPALSESLGLFIQLIVVNCIILGRAEAFASKNGPFYAAIDGVSMGLGFTLALCAMGFIRELLGNGAILGHQVLPQGASMIAAPAGGFIVLGLLVALTQYLKNRPAKKKGGDQA